MSDIAIEGVRDGDLTEILRNFERFWGDRDLPRYLHHPMFFVEFRDTAFVARDLGNGEIAGYLLGFVAPAGDGYIHFVAVRDDSRTLGLGRALAGGELPVERPGRLVAAVSEGQQGKRQLVQAGESFGETTFFSRARGSARGHSHGGPSWCLSIGLDGPSWCQEQPGWAIVAAGP